MSSSTFAYQSLPTIGSATENFCVCNCLTTPSVKDPMRIKPVLAQTLHLGLSWNSGEAGASSGVILLA
ncbi:hypothetical protein TNCV_2842301 [Trichonephila clavipes]|nr:hypothetical protein TNCV_2842301 [Trichonephila clavipes]